MLPRASIAVGGFGCVALWTAYTFSSGTVVETERVGVERSVVRVTNHAQRGDWSSPWDESAVGELLGSGFVIEGGLILTNAHIVSDSRLLFVNLHNDPHPYQARVVHVAHDCDLALLRPDLPEALVGLPHLPLGELPRLGSSVETLGYPAGGEQLSSTRGVVSRIEPHVYVHSGADRHLAVQTDAAINPGASGGPVIQDGRVVGVAFQGNTELESVGYFIADEVIKRFLADIRDGAYDGYPELGIRVEGLLNPALREHLELPPGEGGVRVSRVFPGGSAVGRIEVGDVILAVGERAVANDGSVSDGDGRIPFGMLIDRMQVGENVRLRILRGGERVELDIPLARFSNIESHSNAYDRRPRYFVYGGLVFVPLELELLKTFGPNWRTEAPRALLDAFLVRPELEPERLGQERVVLLRRLSHPVNADMAWSRDQVVDRVNGRRIRSLAEIVDALENHDGDYHEIEFEAGRRFAVLDRRKVEQANAEILERYGIHRDRRL